MKKLITTSLIATSIVAGVAAHPVFAQDTTTKSSTTVKTANQVAPLTITIPVDTAIFHKKGQTVLITSKDVTNGTYKLTITSRNNDSIHDGNNIIVKSSNGSLKVEDVESKAFTTKTASGRLVVTDGKVSVYAEIGDKTFSGGLDVVLTKIEKISVCDLNTQKVVTIEKDAYNPTLHKEGDCVTSPKDSTPVNPQETPKCTIEGKTNLLETDANCKEDPKKCTVNGKVTLLESDPNCKEDPKKCTVEGKEDMLASDKDCKAPVKQTATEQEPTVTELPKTGPVNVLLSLLPIGAVTAAALAYVRSLRR